MSNWTKLRARKTHFHWSQMLTWFFWEVQVSLSFIFFPLFFTVLETFLHLPCCYFKNIVEIKLSGAPKMLKNPMQRPVFTFCKRNPSLLTKPLAFSTFEKFDCVWIHIKKCNFFVQVLFAAAILDFLFF